MRCECTVSDAEPSGEQIASGFVGLWLLSAR